jgi:hypothetical protein
MRGSSEWSTTCHRSGFFAIVPSTIRQNHCLVDKDTPKKQIREGLNPVASPPR